MRVDIINYKETHNIRHQVLWPDKPIEFSMLEDDINGIHYGKFLDNKLISVASIFIEGNTARLRKFATLPQYQNEGHGTFLLNYIVTSLMESGIKALWCDARVTAEEFYNRFQMKKCSDIFLKSGVEYIKMERVF